MRRARRRADRAGHGARNSSRRISATRLPIVEVKEPQLNAVFDFDLTQIVEMRLPRHEMSEQIRVSSRDEDVAAIATVHHALREVDPATGNVVLSVDVRNAENVAAVHPHAQLQIGVVLQGRGDLRRAPDRRADIVEEHQRRTIPCRHADHLTSLHRPTILGGTADRLAESLQHARLHIRGQLRIPNDVSEKHMRHYRFRRFGSFGVGRRRNHRPGDMRAAFLRATADPSTFDQSSSAGSVGCPRAR